ncbi:MAG: hypothetical protein AB7T06_12965 [Kofleriaceae bacterium]
MNRSDQIWKAWHHRTFVLPEAPGDEWGLARVRASIGRMPEGFVYREAVAVTDEVNEYLWDGPYVGDLITIVDDFQIATRYVRVSSRFRLEADKRRASLGVRVGAVTRDELLLAAKGPDTRAIIRLVLGVPLDHETVMLIDAALDSDDRDTRKHAIVAASLSASELVVEPLSRALSRAADPGELQMIRLALSSCDGAASVPPP